MIDVDGVAIRTEVAGPPAGPVIGALHGFGSGAFTWAGVAPTWAVDHRVVAWDRPPFGDSDRPAPGTSRDDPYGLPAVLEQASAVLRAHVHGAPLVLVGHSAGALVATQLARDGRSPVAGLVLVAPALAGAPPAAVRRIAALPGAGRFGASALRLGALGAAPLLRAVGRHRSPLTDATAAAAARALRRPGTAEALWHLTSTWQPPGEADSREPLDIPVLVIGGRDDRISPPEATADTARRLGGELHLLDGVGHAPQETAPATLATLVGAFVATCAR